MRLIAIFRRPYTHNHRVTITALLTEFSEYLESVILFIEPLVITGDFNIHVDATENHDAVRFLELLESVNHMQHVDKTTHVLGHTLDLIITRQSETLLVGTPVPDYLLSDQAYLVCEQGSLQEI